VSGTEKSGNGTRAQSVSVRSNPDRATAYYFIIPLLAYIFVKAMFIAFAQSAPVVQAVSLIIMEAAFLIGVCILRPWMDKKTNIYNISIAVVNFLNAIFLLIFTNVFNQPGLVTGVMGVIFFVYNAAFALTLLLLVLIASVYAILSKDPDMRYQPMRDDRGSFIKSQTQLTTELDALGATARGDIKPSHFKFDDDAESFSSGNGASIHRSYPENGYNIPNSRQAPASPIDPSVPLFPSDTPARQASPPSYESRGYQNGNLNEYYPRSQSNSPAPQGYQNVPNRSNSSLHLNTYRAQNNSSPWHRGAGFDH
jgi:hypothetical protein